MTYLYLLINRFFTPVKRGCCLFVSQRFGLKSAKFEKINSSYFVNKYLFLFSKSKLKQKRAAASQGTNRKGHEKDVKEKKHEKSSDRLTVTREATAPKDKQGERTNTSGNLSDRSESTDDPDKYVISML